LRKKEIVNYSYLLATLVRKEFVRKEFVRKEFVRKELKM